MKTIHSHIMLVLLTSLIAVSACNDITKENFYQQDLCSAEIVLQLPQGAAGVDLQGTVISITDVNSSNKFSSVSDAAGKAEIELVHGLYSIAVSAVTPTGIFNAVQDRVKVLGDNVQIKMDLKEVKTGDIVIKEIYCGGCTKAEDNTTYQYDKYFMLHNNSANVVYLDSLCFGTMSPYNATANNPWVKTDASGSVFPEFVPIIQALWQFPGNGKTFPLQPGADAVVALCGGIDHTVNYPASVNLNKADYFLTYNSTYFTNTNYHPAPGDQIRKDHILSVVVKTGQANAYTFSLSSPTLVIFKTHGITIQDFVKVADNIIPVPGSTNDNVVCIPNDWIMDGVEVFDGRSSANKKRLSPSIDAGYSTQTDIYKGYSHFRKVNEAKSAAVGYEVLVDTNNSSNDFYQNNTASLHE